MKKPVTDKTPLNKLPPMLTVEEMSRVLRISRSSAYTHVSQYGRRQLPGPVNSPNDRLAWERLRRGWSRHELAAQIRRNMVACGEPESGLSGETVRRWEIGARRPGPRYRKHLVLVFGAPADQLGLLGPGELALSPTAARS